MADRIALRGLALETVVGVFDWERTARRTIRADVELECDLSAAAASDRLEDTADYAGLAQRLRERAAGADFRLLEALAGSLAAACLEDARVLAARVSLHKPGAVPGVADVEVAVERRRR